MKKILVLAMLTCCGFINSIFAGDNIEEIESALKNNLLRRNLQNLKSSPNEVSYQAYGSDLGKTFGSGSIDLYFDLPSGLVGDLTLKINAYDVDYPSATEKDLVYFNDKKIGRLEGRNGTYVVDTFKVPASYIKSGQNKLRIDVNVSNEGWVTAVSEAILTGSSFVLKASDGTHPYGVKLEWTNIGADKYEIWRSEHSLFDYSPKKIAEVSSGNTYIDENTEVGAVYDYYIKVGEQTSTEDTGFSGKKSVTPIITNVETSKIWLQHSGGMKQVRITWNDFSRKLYYVRDLVFVLENSTKPFYIHHMPNISYDSSKGTYYTELSLDSCILDTHGKLKVNLFWEYRDTSKDFTTSCPVSQKFDVNVFYDKYGIQDNIPNWFRYWHDDKAIKNADKYIAVELVPNDESIWVYDNKFRFYGFAGKYTGLNKPQFKIKEKLVKKGSLPETFIISDKEEVVSSARYVSFGAAARDNLEFSVKNGEKKIESDFKGIECFASVIKHEQKHHDNAVDLYKQRYLVIRGNRTNYADKEHNICSIEDYTNKLNLASNIGIANKNTILGYIKDNNYITDFDGDGLNDQEEKDGKYKDFEFLTNNPDTWSFQTIDKEYATYGDNEVLARDAEKDGSKIINRENDWAFPGEKIAKSYSGYRQSEWDIYKGDVLNSLALFSSTSYKLALKNHQNLQGEDSSSDEESIFCYSTETDNLPEFVDIEDTGSVSIIGPATSVVLPNESGLFTNLVFNLTVTNSSDIIEYRNITGWLVDSNGEPVAITKTGFTIPQYKSITVPLKFDGNIIHRSNATGFTLKFISLTEDTEFGPDIKQMLQDVASLEREYSYEEFAGDILSIDKDGIEEIYSEEGLTFNIPFTSTIKDDLCKITLSLADTNGTYVASTTKEVSCVEGTNLVPVLFDAQTLYCSNISGPYKVQFVEVELSSGEKQRVWYAYISNEYSYKDFRSDSAVIDIDTSSVNIFAREAGSVSGYDAIVCNFDVSNSLDHAVSYTCEMILRNTNGTLVASSSEVKRFEQGNNDISLYFSGDDIIESQIDGPYVVSEITLEPLDEIGIKERFLPEHEAIDLTISDFRTRSFYLKSIPEYKGKLEENLLINVVVERPTEITATALLIDGFGEYVATATSTITAPSNGDYTLDLSFDVAEIRASGHPGPYKISYLRLKSNIEGEKDLLIDEFEVSDIILWDYVLENGGAKICDGDSTLAMLNSTSGSLVIPSTIDGYPVTAIGDNTFSFFNNLTSVTIPDTVTSIGAEAFYGCSGITNLFIPNSVKSIGSRAFSSCSSLTTLIAGQYVCANRISNIFPDAYQTIKNIEILDGVTTIGNYAFQNCSSLINLTIPDSVTSIGDYAFANCNNIKNLTIPDSVTNISNSAFGGCSNLTSVIIGQYVCTNQISNIFPDSYSVIENIQISDEVTRIGDDTFSGCSNLKNISLPNGLTSIGYEAFSGCEALINITIPNSVISIGGYSFSGCSGLTSISIPESVINIGRGPFSGCDGLTNIIVSSNNPNYKSVNGLLLNKDGTTLIGGINGDVIIPDGVESIGDVAFSARVNLTSITIPNSVTNIDTFAFSGCSGLTSITIPNSVTSIGNCAFSQCFGITNIIIGSCVTNIGRMAFSGCSGLTSITIPNSVKRIADGAFGNCRSLKSITIPDTVTSIEYDTFSNCRSLTSIIIPNSVKSIAHGAFSNCRSLTSLTIPNGVTSIDYRTFSECSSLISITIPDSVTSIGNSAFSGCSGLTSITIPYGVTNIGDYAFKGCSSLTSITIPDSVTSIGKETFSECSSLVSITIPDGITSIGDGAFDGCSGLTTITMPDSVTHIGNSAFSGCSGLTSITIPDAVESIGENAFNLCSGLTSITIPNSVANISSNAFVCCSNLTSAVIGQYVCTNKLSQIFPDSYSKIETIEILNGVTTIGDSAFRDCSSLTSITIPDGVTRIDPSAFRDCSGLTSITIPDSVTSIGDSAFEGCSGLTSIVIPDGVTKIRYSTFSGCSGLTNITIPNSVTSIENSAFRNCSGLTSVTIGNSVTHIGNSAFSGCNGLTSINIPEGVTHIGNSAFMNCSGLTSIIIPNSVTNIGDYAFRYCGNLTEAIFLDDAPEFGMSVFGLCHEDFVVKVKKGTKGWDGDPNSTELPETWYGYPIEYATEDDWAKYLVVDLSGGANASSYPVITRFYVPSSGWTDEYKTNKLVLRRIPAGKMPRTDVDITLTKDYYVGVFEVTQKQWELVMGSNPSDFDGDTLPVECVSYDDIRGTSNGSKWPVSKGVDATSFMGKLRAKTGVNFDLPTEAQWEFSCRAGSSGDWGLLADGSISTLDAMGWYVNNSDDEMHAVGLKTPNAYGLYDMHGNVCEWCLDWYSSRGYAGTDSVGGTSGGSRVFRGGFYNDLAGGCTALDRNYYSPDNRFNSFGFRLAAPSGIFDEEAILQKNVVVYSKDGIATNYETVEAALSAVVDGDIITVLSDYTGIENNKELEFDRIGDINFTLTGSNSLSKLPVVTFNDTNEDGGKIHLTITNANLNLPEIDARKNSVVNIYDTAMQLGNAAPGNSIVKAYFNGVVNAYTNTVLQSYIFLAMGKVNFYDNAYLDSGVARIYGNGLVTINDNAKIDIGGLELTGRAYNGRDNTDADRIGKPAEICINSGLLNVRSSAVVGATSTNGRLVIGSNGSLHLGNEGIKILAGSSLISAGNINGNINAEEGSVIEISGGVYTMDVSKWCVEGTTVIKDLHSEGYWTVLPSNKGYVKFELGDYGTQDGGGDLIQIFDKTGYNANPPIVAAKTGWVFDGWSEGYNNLSENIIIYAKYRSILPNLNVETISFDKREINSGETLTINWCVKNTGNSQFFGTMTERVWLVSSENSEIKTLLTEKPFTGVIGGCDGIVERSEKISLPKKGLEGEWLIQIETAISPSVNIYAQNKSSISNEMLVIKGVSVLTLAQALDTTNLTWKTSPDYQWLPLRAAKAFDSIDCAISGPIPDNTNSWIQTTVVGPGIISFAAMVSCEEGYDWFDFYVDGKLNGYYSGNTGWFVDSFEIGEGTHELTWVYWKDEIDENIGSYQNIAYLDSVVWTPENVSIPDYKDEEKAHTLSTEVSVPYSWLNAYPELISEYSGDYEAAANSLAANGINKVWECYVAGLDPTDESAKFIVEIAMNGDIPIISWSPDLETRNYIIEGTETLNPPLWISPTNSTHHFFRVKVALQEEKDPVIIEKAITISFDPCGGYVSQTSLTYNHEGLLGELPTPTFEGYSFVGWFDKKAGGVEYTKISNIPASNMTLYAVWTSNAYAINFDANGGTGTMLSQTFAYGEEQTLCANTFTREGYTFAGWATTPDGEVVYTSGQNISITASMTLYAVWKANAYLVIDLSGGTSAASYPVTTLSDVPFGGWTDEYKTTKLVLRRIPAGKIPRTDVDITLTKDYYVGVFEVTQKQWELVMGSNPSNFDGDTLPVEWVTYSDIRGTSNGLKWPASNIVDETSFMGKLRAKTGIDFDLPTEAQWEYACRAGSSDDYGLLADGSIVTLDTMSWCADNSGNKTHIVGTKTPNAYGVYDMHGNVWEWCLDWYSDNGYSGTDPIGSTSGSNRVLRGGSICDGICSASIRNNYNPGNRSHNLGFRLVAPAGF